MIPLRERPRAAVGVRRAAPRRRSLAVPLMVAGCAWLAGCGGGDQIVLPPPVARVSVSPTTASVTVGGSLGLQATVFATSGAVVAGAPVVWTSLSPAVATVSASGVVTGVSAGTAVVVAASGSQQGQATIVVQAGTTGGGSGSVVVNTAALEQVMAGWEATAQAGQGTAAFPLYRDTLFSLAVNDLGINRLRVAVRSGIEDTIDYYSLRKSLAENAYNCISYQTVNDNGDPNQINPAGFHFAEIDSTIEEVVLPMKQRLEARGEHLYLNFNYTAFSCAGQVDIHTNPAEYAEFVLAVFQHAQQKYGLVPDAWEMILEPDNHTPWGNPALIGAALAAAAQRLAAAGYHPAFIAPSTESAALAAPWFDALEAVPGVPGKLMELSYHRYLGVSATSIAAIGQRTVQYGVRSAMLEHIGADYNELIDDLLHGRVSAWQQYTLAFTGADNGGKYYVVNVTNPAQPTVTLSSRARYLRQFFRYVRFGAVRVDAATKVGGVTPVAFVNADGRVVVVIRAAGAVSLTVQGLPPGTYGETYTTAAATDVASADQTITAGQLVQATIPAAGILTIFGR